MNNALLLFSPLVNVGVTALFAGVVLRQYIQRRRVYQLFWAIALTMAFLATLAYTMLIFVSPTSGTGMLLFRVYYILGAALMPSWLGLGSLALISNPRLTRLCLAVLVILSMVALSSISIAGIDTFKLSHVVGTPGVGVLEPGVWRPTIIILNSLGVLAVVGVAAYSGWKLLRRQKTIGGFRTSALLWANALILAGDLLNATAGSLALLLHLENGFWLIMAAGWIVFFSGVLLTSYRLASARQPATMHEDATISSR